jgi:hypothetical protein
MPELLCEPYLLDPQPDSVYVVWHTEQPGDRHAVLTGPAVAGMSDRQAVEAATGQTGPGWRRHAATTTRLARTREDADSAVPGRSYPTVTDRPVHRHLAHVTGLRPGRTPYRVVSIDGDRATVSGAYTLAPAAGGPVRLLLTSDHQLKAMTPANLAKVAETVGYELDGVLAAGDLVNVPDRASDWFDSARGHAFFASFTGRAGSPYRGAPILQHTPLFPAIGNHEVMGRWSDTDSLNNQFSDPQPRTVDPRGWDTTTYEQLFPYPRSAAGGPRWWSRTIGDVHLTALFVTRIWRSAPPAGRGRFQEAAEDLTDPARWGYGQHIYEPIGRGSRQYEWLARTLSSADARRARYRVVMFHHSSHGVGDHSTPPFADPVQTVHRDPSTGTVTAVTYHYPLAGDQILRDLEPLLSSSGVQLVHHGHSHLWNRFRNDAGVNWLETSNVGNSYGAYHPSSGAARDVPDHPDYPRQGDPGGLAPIVPAIAPLAGPDGAALPYLASNDITAFSVLDSGAGVVRSYRFDTREPDSETVLFDEFPLG